MLLMHLEALLEDAEHIVVGTAISAEDAIALIEKTRPDLVLLDLDLASGSSGREVARAMRDQEHSTILFVTANAQQLDDDMEGAVGVIAKPYSVALMEGSLAYLEECVRRPPPVLLQPAGLRLAPAYLARLTL